jgi:broad specificity phosphatase PhoE
MTAIPFRVHWLRHGRVPHHRGDVPVTELGLEEAEEAAKRMVTGLEPAEVVLLSHTATLRSRETAYVLDRMMRAHPETHPNVRFLPPREEPAIRNPDIFIGGLRVEMVSTAEAMAEQTAAVGLGPDIVGSLPFYSDFFRIHDRIGYWIGHPDPPGENSDAVARRMMAFAVSLSQLGRERPGRYICVTHSPCLRAFLTRHLLHEDPGEPEFMESIDLTFPGDGTVEMRYRDHVWRGRPGEQEWGAAPARAVRE